jgi:hypothetical protein
MQKLLTDMITYIGGNLIPNSVFLVLGILTTAIMNGAC